MDKITEKVKNIVAEQLGVQVEDVREESQIIDDLGADSLDCIEVVMALESAFDVEISDEKAERVKSVQDAIHVVKNAIDPLFVIPEPVKLPALKRRFLTMTVSDGSTWGVPVMMIARHRAKHYAGEFDDNIERSLAEDTIPLFNSSDYDIEDWAVNNMNWSDFTGHHVKLREGTGIDFQEAWMECEKGLQ